MGIIRKIRSKALVATTLCVTVLSSVVSPITVSAAEGAYRTTRERIEAEYTLTDKVTDWSDNSQKNYEIADGSTDTDYLIKSVEWTDIDKGEATITLAGANTEESVALFVFTTCTGHVADGSCRDSEGLMPEVILRDIEKLQEMYDRVDCVVVNGNDTWGTIEEAGHPWSYIYARTTDVNSQGGKYWDPACSSFIWDCTKVIESAGGLDQYYIGINPVKSFTKANSENDIKNWLMSFPWINGQHNSASIMAGVRSYLFGSLHSSKYGNAQKNKNPEVYKAAVQNAIEAKPEMDMLVNRPTAIYTAADAVCDYPSNGLGRSVSKLYSYSADSEFIDFVGKNYTTYEGGQKRYFSLASSKTFFNQATSDGSEADDLTLKAYTAFFQPGEVAKNQNARVVHTTASGHITYTSQGTEYLEPDYEYQDDFSTAGVLTPDKNISISDTISEAFEIISAEAFTTGNVHTTVSVKGQAVKATADQYISGDELTLTIKVKLKAGNSTQIEGQTISASEENAVLYDGNVSISTVAPKLYLPGADILTTDVDIVCYFDDDNDRDGLRTSNVTVTLIGSDGSRYSETLKNSNGGTLHFNGLIKSIDGEEVTYSVKADLPDGYKIASVESAKIEGNNQLIATFYHKPQTKSIQIRKVWDDKNNVDGIRPDSITVKLKGSDGSNFTKKLYANNGWEATADNLYAYYDHGKEMEYTLEEVSVDGYSGRVDKNDAGDFEVTNIHTQELRTLIVTADWNDDNNRDGVRPDSFKIVLTGSDGSKKEAEIKKSGDWQYEFKNIPVNADGRVISYSLSQSAPDGYTGKVTVAQGTKGFVITNTHAIARQEISVKQVWSDDNNRDGIRPDRLKATIKGSDGEEYTQKLYADNDWTVDFKNLPVFYGEGKKIVYTLSETTATGYSNNTEKSSDELKYTVTNTHNPERRNISVYKKWNDSNDADCLRRDVELTLTGSDGSKYNGKIYKDSADQEYTFKNLYRYANGEEIRYTVSEKEMPGYTTDIVEAKDGFTITNTHKATFGASQDNTEVTDKDDNKWTPSDDEESQRHQQESERVISVPKTGDGFKFLGYGLAGIVFIAAALFSILYVKRKEDDADE